MAETGFTTMAGAKAGGAAPEIGVGMLGYAFMGKAHTNAFKKIPYMMYPPPAVPRLVAICGRTEAATTEAARRYGYEQVYTDWRKMLEDDRLQLFDNGGPNNMHAEPCIEAAKAGKHILCEKPLARTGEEARRMLEAATCLAHGRLVCGETRDSAGLVTALRTQTPPGARIFDFSVDDASTSGMLAIRYKPGVKTAATIEWDSAAMKVKGEPAADAVINLPVRTKWL